MDYILHKRFRGNAICGKVNIPAKTPLEEVNGMIFWNGNLLFTDRSQNALDYATRNDDGRGMERAKLSMMIKKTLERMDAHHQERWDKVWGDKLCQKYKRIDHADYWLWNKEFFNAPIEDLRYIAALVGVKKGV